MITEKTREIIELGMKEEFNSTDGKVIHKFPAFETSILLSWYDHNVENDNITPLDDFIMEELAKTWELYFKLGPEEYRETQFNKPLKKGKCKKIYPKKTKNKEN